MKHALVFLLILFALFTDQTTLAQSQKQNRIELYVDNTRGNWVRKNLSEALSIFQDDFERIKTERRPVAADLGAGAGNETLHLFENGWNVITIDIEPYPIATVNERIKEIIRTKFNGDKPDNHYVDARITSMQNMDLLPNSLDLINASYSLPFVPARDMPAVWNNIVTALRPGGVFTGHFFGTEHEWRTNPELSFYSVNEIVRTFIEPFSMEIYFLLNEKEETPLGVGRTAFFHTITIIAKKTGD
jgi:SAM-dependent methyltransferase